MGLVSSQTSGEGEVAVIDKRTDDCNPVPSRGFPIGADPAAIASLTPAADFL
jgi:hypothetical protein